MSLFKQLENTRLERAFEVVESLADHRALLTTSELGRLNQIVNGSSEDPWRTDTVTLSLPSGHVETLSIVADPKITARDKLHQCTEMAEGGDPVTAAIEIYIALVLAHVFREGNRRTAVLAAQYFLRRYGYHISGWALHEINMGDIRGKNGPDQLRNLRTLLKQVILFSSGQKK